MKACSPKNLSIRAQQNNSGSQNSNINSLKGSIPSKSSKSEKSQISHDAEEVAGIASNNAADSSPESKSSDNFYYLRRPLRGGTGELERIIAIEEKENESSNASFRSKSSSAESCEGEMPQECAKEDDEDQSRENRQARDDQYFDYR